jgi:hypothetical protein
MAATREQSPEMLNREPSKRPYGATWLNGERWEDEPSAPVNGSGAKAPERAAWDIEHAKPLTEEEMKRLEAGEIV